MRMSLDSSLPLPLDPLQPKQETDGKRLWIGNIDSRVTEYKLLKLVQQFGQIEQFDFLFHKSGPLKGQPRGYSFVTYESRDQAEKALTSLNGKLVLDKALAVRWAHAAQDQSTSRKPDATNVIEDKKPANTFHQILAIEAKLAAMEDKKELEISLTTPATAMPSTDNHKKRVTPYSRHNNINRHQHRSR